MLVLTRKTGEGIVIDGGIVITVLEAHDRKVRLGIQAPDDVLVLREELAEFKMLPARSYRTKARPRVPARQSCQTVRVSN
jgi:carbon storage regulator